MHAFNTRSDWSDVLKLAGLRLVNRLATLSQFGSSVLVEDATDRACIINGGSLFQSFYNSHRRKQRRDNLGGNTYDKA